MPYNNVISRTDAAALMPEEVSRVIMTEAIQQSAAMKLFRHVPVSRAQQRIPVVSALPTAYFVNGDTGVKQTTEVDWTNKYLNIEEVAAIVPIPEAVLDDAEYDVWGAIRPLLVEAIGITIDAAVFFGVNKPSSWPTDIVAAAASAGNTATRGTVTQANGGLAGDISAAFAKVEADGFDVNGVIANRLYRGYLRQVRATTGQRLPEIVNMVSVDEVYGVGVTYPMRGLWPTGSGAASAIVGDFTQGIFGVRQDITYKILDQAVLTDNTGAIQYNLAQQDMVALRIVTRIGWQVPNPINRDQQTEASRYPFATLLEA